MSGAPAVPPGVTLHPEVVAFLQRPKALFIGGAWTEAVSGEAIASENPATGEVLARVPVAHAADVDGAVRAARAAVEGAWGELSGAQRGALLWALAERVAADADALAQLETLDSGKPLWQSAEDVRAATAHLRYFAGWADKLAGATLPVAGKQLVYTLLEPHGVAGLIVPWNFPLLIAVWKLAPALACGNAVVLKPAEQTPLSALRLAELSQQAGFPAGVLNLVTGPGEPTGAALARHPEVDKLSFTGSTVVGRRVLAAAAESNLKRVSLELGGKSPNLIFADADLARASEAAVWAAFFNSGQECTAGARLYVERAALGEVSERIAAHVAALRVGNGLSEVDLGPLISAAQRARVLRYLDTARAEGAQRLAEGAPLRPELRGGHFLPPVVLAHTHDDLTVVREEVFGPVLTVSAFEDAEEAVQRANATRYGLAAGVWTADLTRAHRIAKALQAGTVWLNGYDRFDPAAPFGGYKESGQGREMGAEALALYTQSKTVWLEL